jgi:putative phage-type endonuclease
MEQRSDEWFVARGGCVTGSRVADIMADGAGRKNYMAELVAYRLTGRREESFTSAAMLRGVELEETARTEYEMRNLASVEQVGIAYHPTIIDFAGSPDGLVGAEGGIEIKCPNTATHIDTLLNGTIKKDYIIQMQSYMAVTGRAWFDFVSFDDRLPEDLSFYQKRIFRDEKMIRDIESAVQKFLFELEELEQMLREKA